MKKISDQLSSLHFATWTLVVLLLWFVWGILLAGSETFSKGFYLMNGTIVRHWLTEPDNGFFLLKLWFVGLCVVVTFLGINLVFCSWNKIFKFIITRFNGPKVLMLFVHILFGLVALGHLCGFMLGYRHDAVRLSEGQVFRFEDGHEVRIVKIHFMDDPGVLKKSKRELTGNEFHYRSNYAEVVLSKQGREICRSRVYMLKPMRSKSIQVTLKRFTPPSTRRGDIKVGKPGVIFVISKNPVSGVFLISYPLMIVGIGIYLMMTWHNPGRKRLS